MTIFRADIGSYCAAAADQLWAAPPRALPAAPLAVTGTDCTLERRLQLRVRRLDGEALLERVYRVGPVPTVQEHLRVTVRVRDRVRARVRARDRARVRVRD